MEFREVLETRKSFHSFEDRNVERSSIEEAVEVARRAPSAWNVQPWKLFILESEEKMRTAVKTSYGQEWMLEADKICVVAGDREFRGVERAFEDMIDKGYRSEDEAEEEKEMVEGYRNRSPGWKELELTSNCIFFASDLIEALWSRGIGTCPVKGFDQEQLGEELDLDSYYPVLLLPVGYPDGEKDRKYRKEAGEILEFL
ncbi:MAG: nitroreductase family protein [Candidatus Nanohaloarchaea archaeon]